MNYLTCRDARSVRPDDAANARPDRKSPRASFHDYSAGNYFVTICTKDKEHFFGEIFNDEMHLTPIGEFCQRQMLEISAHYPYAEVRVSTVMPNHVHAIITINPDAAGSQSAAGRTHRPCVPTYRSLLSVVIGGFKRTVTMYGRRNNIDFDWQERFHDHIIRDHSDGNNISKYIKTNVIRWDADCFHPRKFVK